MLDPLNKSVKASLTRDVRKNAVLGVGSHVNTAVASPCAVFATQPHPSYYTFCTSLAMVL